MTQAIINNAAAISYDRDATVAQSISISRNLKWFRKGPIQSLLEVQMNVVTREVYQPILATLSGSLVGPYTMTLPAEVVGTTVTENVTVPTANQVGNQITVLFASSISGTGGYTAGTIVQFPGDTRTYVLTADAAVQSDRTAVLFLDQPVAVSPPTTGTLSVGSGINFSFNLINRPRAAFGPTGLVNHDGSFVFAEVV